MVAFTAFYALLVVESLVNAKLDTGIGYGFRNWHYVIAEMKFAPDDASYKVCMDTGCSVTLIDRKWLQTNKPEPKPRRQKAVPEEGEDDSGRMENDDDNDDDEPPIDLPYIDLQPGDEGYGDRDYGDEDYTD
jgi:hypothetical protein